MRKNPSTRPVVIPLGWPLVTLAVVVVVVGGLALAVELIERWQGWTGG